MQALVNIAKIPEGIIAFFESPAWGNVQKIIADAYNVTNGWWNCHIISCFRIKILFWKVIGLAIRSIV